MSRAKYQYIIWYEFKGPSKADVSENPKTEKEINWAFETIPNDISMALRDDPNVCVALEDKGDHDKRLLTVVSELPEKNITQAVKESLASHNFFGELI
jgi:hypothetical protein